MGIIVILVLQVCIETDRSLFIQSLLNDILQIRESTSADKQNILRIHCSKRHHGVLAVRTYRNFHFTAFEKLQHSLLYSLTADISLIGVLFLRNLINLIDENNTMFRPLHIIIRCCQKLGHNTLDIIADITGFCQ